jgi:uncharacterized protein (DUF488 family)
LRLWTIGHSTHSLDEFLSLLAEHDIQSVADVRAVPKSSRCPHFLGAALARELPECGIGYVHIPALGGWRRATPDSRNGAWRNASFRGYADHALTDAFAQGLHQLRDLGEVRRTAMMCAEALWWRCHRRLIADHLVGGGWEVEHIGSDGRASNHIMSPFAVVGPGRRVSYPGPTTTSPRVRSAVSFDDRSR